jgi:hypothetical protein
MFNHKLYRRRIVVLVCTILLSLPLLAATSVAPGTPKVWGYGVKSCADFTAAHRGSESGDKRETVEYLRFQEWFSGLVTGLSLATGKNILNGADVKGAMRRLQQQCEEQPQSDFFQAATNYLRLLGTPEE